MVYSFLCGQFCFKVHPFFGVHLDWSFLSRGELPSPLQPNRQARRITATRPPSIVNIRNTHTSTQARHIVPIHMVISHVEAACGSRIGAATAVPTSPCTHCTPVPRSTPAHASYASLFQKFHNHVLQSCRSCSHLTLVHISFGD